MEIEHKGGTEKVYIDQGKGDPLFGVIYLGKYEFEPGKTARVTIRNNDHGRYILYDVARWIYVE